MTLGAAIIIQMTACMVRNSMLKLMYWHDEIRLCLKARLNLRIVEANEQP